MWDKIYPKKRVISLSIRTKTSFCSKLPQNICSKSLKSADIAWISQFLAEKNNSGLLGRIYFYWTSLENTEQMLAQYLLKLVTERLQICFWNLVCLVMSPVLHYKMPYMGPLSKPSLVRTTPLLRIFYVRFEIFSFVFCAQCPL